MYDGFNFDLGDDVYFQFATGELTGSPILLIELSSGLSSQTINGAIQLSPSSGGVFTIDITQLPNFSETFISQFDTLTVMLYHDTAFSIEGESFVFSSTIPEPAVGSLSLGAVALLALRRRRTP